MESSPFSPPSPPPRLVGGDPEAQAGTIFTWFAWNFAKIEAFPAPIGSAAETRKFILHIAEVREELRRAFPEAVAGAIDIAIARIQQQDSTAWLPARSMTEVAESKFKSDMVAALGRARSGAPIRPPAAYSPAARAGKTVGVLVLILLATAMAIALAWAVR